MPSGQQPDRWKPGQPLTAQKLDQLSRGTVSRLTPSTGIRSTHIGNRITMGLDPAAIAQTIGAWMFPVWVVKDDGENGTKSAAATYTYTVKTVDQASELGTAVAVTRPRPYGKVTYYASGGYGVAFYLNETLILWDAGEIPYSRACE
jgi:hypothetical protein